MATAADKKRWDDLHVALAKVEADKLEFERGIWARYGGDYQRSWLTRGEQNRFDAFRERAGKVEDKIFDLVVRISPRGDAWKHGVPGHWVTHDLTWEDAIRPVGEPLSVVVPPSWGNTKSSVTERRPMTRQVRASGHGSRNLESTDAAHLREFIERGVHLVGGEAEGIDIDDPSPVFVSIVVDVTGIGPHQGVICAYQNRFHGNPNKPLEQAYEILEDWIREHYHEGGGDESVTETFDAVGWKLSARDFATAIAGTKAAEYIEVYSSKSDEPEQLQERAMPRRMMNAPHARKEIQELIEELKAWLPNYDHTADSYPTMVFRMLASVPGGEELEGMGYEPFPGMSWHEFDQLGRLMAAIQDKRDVEDIVEALTQEEEEDAPPPAPPVSRHDTRPARRRR